MIRQKKFILEPNLTLWFELSVEEAQNRLDQRSLKQTPVSQGSQAGERDPNAKDRLDLESLAFHQRVQQGYQELWKNNSHRIQKVDANGSIEEIQQRLQKQLQKSLRFSGIL